MDNKKTLIDNVIDNPNNLDTIVLILLTDETHYVLKTLVQPNQNLMEYLEVGVSYGALVVWRFVLLVIVI